MSNTMTFALDNQDQLTLQRLSGPLGANFDALSKSLNVEIRRAADALLIKGEDAAVVAVEMANLLTTIHNTDAAE